jgi:hypothetical protein
MTFVDLAGLCGASHQKRARAQGCLTSLALGVTLWTWLEKTRVRVLIIFVLFFCGLLSGVLAGGYILASRYKAIGEKIADDAKQGNLSTVSADLVTPEELAKLKAKEAKKRKKTPKKSSQSQRIFGLGVAMAVSAFLLLGGGVLLLVRKWRMFVLLSALASAGTYVAVLLFGVRDLGTILPTIGLAALGVGALLLVFYRVPSEKTAKLATSEASD